MINLRSLSVLIRTLRSGLDAAASPVARVTSVTPVAEDDAGAVTSMPVRPSPWSRLTALELAADVESRRGEVRRVPTGQTTNASATTEARSQALAATANVEDAQSTAFDFTAGARLLQAALRGTGLHTPSPPEITSSAPLATSAWTPAPELAQGLANAVAASGLFYESHLARALRRDYPVAALSREPQAAWPASVRDGLAPSTSASALPEAASTMLTKQLDVLDTRSLVWNGDVWPGQRATITFAEEREPGEAANDSSAAQASSPWRLQITLELPSLGRVHAQLDFRSGAVGLVLTTTSDDAQGRLTSARSALSGTFADARLALGRFDVELVPDA